MISNILDGDNVEVTTAHFGAGSEFPATNPDTDDDSEAMDTESQTLGLFRKSREVRAARESIEREGYAHVVYGHTHVVVDGIALYDREDSPRLWNPGTWIPFLDLRKGETRKAVDQTGITAGLVGNRENYSKEFYAVEILDTPTGPDVSLELIHVFGDGVTQTN